MLEQIITILRFVGEAIVKSWPYLLVTIPLAVAVQLSGASRYIRRAFLAQPIPAIFLATVVGAFSPFCSCSVIPMVATLLIGGVPLAPVMSFWIASPSMDPEIFFLSVNMLGWELAIWRMIATLGLSISAGLITYFLMNRQLLGTEILRTSRPPKVTKYLDLLRGAWQSTKCAIRRVLSPQPVTVASTPAFEGAGCSCGGASPKTASNAMAASAPTFSMPFQPSGELLKVLPAASVIAAPAPASGITFSPAAKPASGTAAPTAEAPFRSRLLKETFKAVALVLQFMTLAYFLEALIQLYVPEAWVAGLLGQKNQWSIVVAALLGVPVYTSNLTALPLISGLLAQGMSPAAALAFLVSGPTTTLPAMSAVWGLVNRRVFALYIAFSLFGALIFGYIYLLVMSL